MKKYIYIRLLSLACIALSAISANAQINVYPGQTATSLIATLTGPGIVVNNAVLNCDNNAAGSFGSTGTNLGIDSGIIMTSGRAATVGNSAGANGPTTLFPAWSLNLPGDAQLNAISGVTTYDACVLEFDFLPDGDTIKFNYVFSSTEYFGYSCSGFNDVFGFFVSGPGITGNFNLATVPGTSIPITVNSTTNPVTTNATGSIGTCQSMGPGSPFTQYFVNNQNGTTVTHQGFTTVFTARTPVYPCSTYHLKLAIADGSDGTLDSGVWIKAGSLSSNAIKIKPLSGKNLSNPRPYCVRGCVNGSFEFARPSASSTPLTIKYQIQGTAVNGSDYALIPDSVVIQSGQKTVTRTIIPQLISPASGVKTIKIRILNPYACGQVQILDSAELDILDSFYVKVLNNDTSICNGKTVNLKADTDPLLQLNWKPTIGLSAPTSINTIAAPNVTTRYQLEVTLPTSTCPPAHDDVLITVREKPTVQLGPDRITCLKTGVQMNPTITPTQPYFYSWTPVAGVTGPTTANALLNPTADVTYTLTVRTDAKECDGEDQIDIKVLPNDFTLDNVDVSICKGETVPVTGTGEPLFSYTWTPSNGVKNPFSLQTEIKPDTTATYVVTARYPNCPDMSHQFKIDVQPVPVVYAGVDREMCQWDTVQLHGRIEPDYYNYKITWTPGNILKYGDAERNVVFNGDVTTTLEFRATTDHGCTDADEVTVTVHPGNFATLTPEGDMGICPNDSVEFKAGGTGIVSYQWTPNENITSATSANVKVYPTAKTEYTLLVTDIHNCHDTFVSIVNVHPEAVLRLGDDVTLHPGQSASLNTEGNCTYFEWFPRVGLDATNVSNPVASPDVNTRYIVHARTENGCDVTDSINVIRMQTELDVPNAFVPGSSRSSDLKIIKRGIATLKYFRIFNRWGTKVFETTDIEQGWNGTFGDQPQPMGVYIYSIEAVTDNGKAITKQGNVTLIR